MKEREELHTFSKDSVKHWENTIEVCCFNFYFPTNAADQTVKPINFTRKNCIRLPSYVYLAAATHRLPITRTFKGNRKKFELPGVRVIGSSKKMAESKEKTVFTAQ